MLEGGERGGGGMLEGGGVAGGGGGGLRFEVSLILCDFYQLNFGEDICQ